MPKKGHTEEQIIAALKRYETGDETVDICRKLSECMGTEELTPHEFDVLEQIVHGKSNKDITRRAFALPDRAGAGQHWRRRTKAREVCSGLCAGWRRTQRTPLRGRY